MAARTVPQSTSETRSLSQDSNTFDDEISSGLVTLKMSNQVGTVGGWTSIAFLGTCLDRNGPDMPKQGHFETDRTGSQTHTTSTTNQIVSQMYVPIDPLTNVPDHAATSDGTISA